MTRPGVFDTPGLLSTGADTKRATKRPPGASPLIVAVPEWADPNTVLRTPTFATPLATGTAFAVSIVTMPAATVELARTVIAVNPNDVAVQALR